MKCPGFLKQLPGKLSQTQGCFCLEEVFRVVPLHSWDRFHMPNDSHQMAIFYVAED